MKTILVLASLVALAMGRPQGDNQATILRYENDNSGVDGYKFSYETSDGIQREEEGTLKDVGGEGSEDGAGQAIVVRGSFTWKDEKTGQVYTVNFTADENGYKPEFKTAK